MSRKITTEDEYRNQVFRWDKRERVMSLPHPRKSEILFYELSEDFDFRLIRSEPKQSQQLKLRRKE